MKIAIVNGPNLNLLGTREPSVYGNLSFDQYLLQLQSQWPELELAYFQSNVEGELIDALQAFSKEADCIGIVLNAAAYSHTSVALADTISAITTPVICVHISNIYAREAYRHVDLSASKALGQITGLGLNGYHLAIQQLLLNNDK